MERKWYLEDLDFFIHTVLAGWPRGGKGCLFS